MELFSLPEQRCWGKAIPYGTSWNFLITKSAKFGNGTVVSRQLVVFLFNWTSCGIFARNAISSGHDATCGSLTAVEKNDLWSPGKQTHNNVLRSWHETLRFMRSILFMTLNLQKCTKSDDSQALYIVFSNELKDTWKNRANVLRF